MYGMSHFGIRLFCIRLSDYLIIYPVRSSKGRMDIVNRDQLQCYLPSVELLLFRAFFYRSINIALLINSSNSELFSNFKNNIRGELFSI